MTQNTAFGGVRDSSWKKEKFRNRSPTGPRVSFQEFWVSLPPAEAGVQEAQNSNSAVCKWLLVYDEFKEREKERYSNAKEV